MSADIEAFLLRQGDRTTSELISHARMMSAILFSELRTEQFEGGDTVAGLLAECANRLEEIETTAAEVIARAALNREK